MNYVRRYNLPDDVVPLVPESGREPWDVLREAADLTDGSLVQARHTGKSLSEWLRSRADYLEAEAAEKSQREADAEDAERQLREDIAAMTRAGEGHVDVAAIIRRVREADKGLSDPAVDAARRYWAEVEPDCPLQDDIEEWGMGGAIASGAAREALAPIRELHRPHTEGGWEDEPYCLTCAHETRTSRDLSYQPWPCATDRLVYTTSELENR